ncbi:hypothetical protein Tco_1381052 [Tanacetum coccineum]
MQFNTGRADIRQKTSSEYTNNLLSAEDRYRGRGYDRGQEAKQKQVEIMEDRRDKEVSQAARDFDDALICYVENTIEDRIMDSGASFHATYLQRRVRKVQATLRIGMSMLASKGKVPYVRKVDIYFCNVKEDKKTAKTASGVAVERDCDAENGPGTPLQFGVPERLSRTFKAGSTGIRVEAPKM